MFCYDDTPTPYTGKSGNFTNVDSTKQYLTHYNNRLYLLFIEKSPKTAFTEKSQVRKELITCDRKLNWWSKQENFDSNTAHLGVLDLKKKWNKGE